MGEIWWGGEGFVKLSLFVCGGKGGEVRIDCNVLEEGGLFMTSWLEMEIDWIGDKKSSQ